MTVPVAYGVDFGTTNSSIAIAYPDRVAVLDIEAEGVLSCLPSIAYLHRSGDQLAGMAAVQQYLVAGSHETRCPTCDLGPRRTDCKQFRNRTGGCNNARLISGLKSYLSRPDFESTHSWAVDFSPSDLVGVILRRLKRAADAACGSNVHRAVLGYPVAFVGSEGPEFESRQELALDRLQRAAGEVGFDEIELFPEPAAAIVNESIEDGVVLALDFGGGTFDVAAVRFERGDGEVIALKGLGIGGSHFDQILFNQKVAPALGLESLPLWLLNELGTLSSLGWLLSDPNAQWALSKSRGEGARLLERIIFGGHAYGFYRAIEDAKVSLSTNEEATIQFFRPGGIDVSIPVRRLEFESFIRPELESIHDTVYAALEQADITAKDVAAVVRTGGSGSIPAFARWVEDQFGVEKTLDRPAFSSVVNGLGIRAQELWG